MATNFAAFVAAQQSPGVLLIPSSRSIGAAIEGILTVWRAWGADDRRNRILWLP